MFQRQTEGSLVCPNCGRLVGVRDRECFNCGRRNPGLWGFAPLLRKFGLDFGFTQLVFTVCVAMYAVSLLSDPQNIGGFLGPSTQSTFMFGGSGYWPIVEYGRWWTVLSAAWLHGSLLHIGMNMMWLRQIMPIVQEFYGVGRLIIIYTVASAAGFALTSLMFQPAIPLGPFRGAYFTVGASAPLFGLFGALIVYSKRTGQTALGQEIWRWVMIFVVIGLIVPIIDNWAHLGGYAGGWLAASVLDPLKDESPTHMLIGLVCLLLTAASIVASIVLGIPLFQQG
jgi:rhomboid protease GluP|tara:strand:+ start:1277 stop:2122 length:846 start_codon:yes stop_codon:yes gene_type:complete